MQFPLINIKVNPLFPRGMVRFIKKNLSSNPAVKLVGAEVGVYKGEHAVSIIKYLPMKKLYCIDPYLPYGEMEKENMSECARLAHKRLENTPAVFIEEKSEKASTEIKEELDFVYIDGAHDYESVKQDIALWYEKVKVGGVLGGDDFDNGWEPSHDGVMCAVIEFIKKTNHKLYVFGADWWIVKGETL